jgi:hypothetical protein
VTATGRAEHRGGGGSGSARNWPCSGPGAAVRPQGRPRAIGLAMTMINLASSTSSLGRRSSAWCRSSSTPARHDALPLRAHAGRRRLLRLPGGDHQGAEVGHLLLGLGFGVLLSPPSVTSPSPGSRPSLPRKPTPSAQRAGPWPGSSSRVRVGLRGHQRTADHRRARGDGPGPPRARRPQAHPARAVQERVRKGEHPARCPPRVSTPGTTPSTPRRCCRTAGRAEISVPRPSSSATRSTGRPRRSTTPPPSSRRRRRDRGGAHGMSLMNYIVPRGDLFSLGAPRCCSGATPSWSSCAWS